MIDPTGSTAVAAMAALVSTVTLALFGVDYHSLLYALVGALLALSLVGRMGRGRAVLYVALSTLVGAVLGNLVASYIAQPTHIVLIALCLAFGLVSQAIAAALLSAAPGLTAIVVKGIEAFLARIFTSGGKP